MTKNGFDSERLRKKLLKQKKIKELKNTYSFQLPSIDDGNSGVFWDQKFQSSQEDSHMMAKDRNRIISKLIPSGSKILNLGAGSGYLESLVDKMSEKNVDWIGTDITKKSLDSLKKRFSRWRFRKEILEQLSFKNQSFDVVLLLEVLEHIKPANTFKVLAEINRVLKNNGTFIISIPINEGLEEMYPYNPNQHLRVYSEDLIRFELENSGFHLIKIMRLSAFSKFYYLKKIINNLFQIRQPNNLIIIARKK